jgi:penicillin amidase
MEVFYNLSHAGNINEAAKAVEPLTSPGLNFMWADTAGNIGWWAAGKLPVRPPHVNPAIILEGSTGNDDPLGWLDFKDNPQIINPTRGVYILPIISLMIWERSRSWILRAIQQGRQD